MAILIGYELRQELGFSLDEIREFLTSGDGIDECRRTRDLLHVKLLEIDMRIKNMREFRRTLQQNLSACEREINEHGLKAHCLVIVNIERGGQTATGKESYKNRKKGGSDN